MNTHKRITLLTELEISDIYSLPIFNAVEQLLYFAFIDQEITISRKYRTIKAQIYFMLSLGYFKAKQQFYTFDLDLDVSLDTQYILKKYFHNSVTALSGGIDYKTYQKQKTDILILLGYQDWSSKYKPQIESHICELLRFYPKVHSALRQLLVYFDKQHIVVPTYRLLQDMFTSAFSAEENRLSEIILSIPECKQKQLSLLIAREDGISPLNVIRSDQKDFKYTAVKSEIEKAKKIAELY